MSMNGPHVREIDPQADPAIKASDLSLGYQERPGKTFLAVEGVNLSLKNGSSLGILGESGAGKSTLATYLAGKADRAPHKSDRIHRVSGEGTVLGAPLAKLSRRLKSSVSAHVGYLEQDAGANLSPDLNVGDLIFQPIEERIRRFDRSELGEDVAEMFDIVALPLHMLQKYPYELSKGQRQRVAVIRSLIHSPKVYVADEPTLGVDANNRPRIVDLIKWHQKRAHATLLVISHDIGLLEALIQEILILQQGTAVGFGDINEIFRNASHDYVVKLANALRTNAYDEIAAD